MVAWSYLERGEALSETGADFSYAYINRANARLVRHPGLALSDFHHAGMHPGRGLIGAAAVMLAIGFGVVKRRRSRKAIHA